ncbi:MAG: hypothetical protein CME65_15225 [Halobacteriovoraceae bacterium]|nr:hypothetical protein [Halobacteriovoraceae bacterium]
MKLLHTAHSKAQSVKSGQGGNNLLDAVGNGNTKDPKSLLALKADPKYKNINFDHVLSATEKGHDPEAMANLLVKEQNSEKNAKLPFAKSSPKQNLVKNTEEKQTSMKSILIDPKKTSQIDQSKLASKTPVRTPIDGQTLLQGRTPLQGQTPLQAKVQLRTSNQGTIQNTAHRENQEPARKSIFNTERVVNLQSKSQFADNTSKVNQATLLSTPMKTAMPAQTMNNPAQASSLSQQSAMMTQMRRPTVQAAPAKTQDMMAMRELRSDRIKSRATQATYQNKSQSMIRNTESAESKMIESKGKAVEMLDSQKSADLGESLQRFQGSEINQPLNQTAQVATAAQTGKVLNLNQTQLSTNTDTVISQIQDYVVQAQANNQSEVAVSFEHKDLGQVDLMVQKMDPKSNQLNIQIATRGNEAAEFFKTHQGELLNTLNRSGLQIADLKLESASSNSSQQDLSGDSRQDQQLGSRGQKQSEQGQREADQERRQDLWDQYYENKEAA